MKINLVDALTINEQDSVQTSDRKITAEWHGAPWCLCHGEWVITVGGKKIDLPDEVRTNEMNTFGTYRRWYFGGDSGWEEIWENYEDGLEFESWLQENSWWVSKLGLSDSETQSLYNAISLEDWRYGSCGGCI